MDGPLVANAFGRRVYSAPFPNASIHLEEADSMRLAKPLASVGIIVLLIAGCEAGSRNTASRGPLDALTGPFPVTLPSPGDMQADPEEFEVCKIGSTADFSYTVTDRTVTPNVTTASTLHLDPNAADHGCEVIALKG